MKKAIAAVAAGLMLVAGQAAAAGQTSAARIGDRIGASADESNEFAGVPLAVLVVGAAIIVAAGVALSDDDSESD